jgi:cholesterol oxidase
VAITSSFHPDAETHVESVRYGKGSNAMAYVTTVGVPGQGRAPRWLRGLFAPALHPLVLLRTLLPHRWSERSVIALVMQTLDNSVTTRLRLGRLTSQQGHGAPNPSWIPAGELVNGPMTAHFIGGCTIGDSPQSGVIDPYHRLWGHPAISVVDGSTITANLGVNPSLTITAQAERALSLWPNKGAEDLRPTQGQAYQRLDPIPPHHPTVPQHAFGALWTARPVVPRTVRPAERAEIA